MYSFKLVISFLFWLVLISCLLLLFGSIFLVSRIEKGENTDYKRRIGKIFICVIFVFLSFCFSWFVLNFFLWKELSVFKENNYSNNLPTDLPAYVNVGVPEKKTLREKKLRWVNEYVEKPIEMTVVTKKAKQVPFTIQKKFTGKISTNIEEDQRMREKYEKPIAGDGHCFYRSVARFVYSDQKYYNKVREDLGSYFKNLNLFEKNALYKVNTLTPEERELKLLNLLPKDDGWGGLDECSLVSDTYGKGVFVKILGGPCIIYLREYEFVIQNNEEFSFKEVMKALSDEIKSSPKKENIPRWKNKRDFIFLSLRGRRRGENIIGDHFETFWPK